MSFVNLTDSNILLYAAKCYDKPNCLDSEFDEDYKRIRYIKRLLHRYRITGVVKERLILNHMIVVQNVFGIEASTRMLFCKIDYKDHSALKTFLSYTSAMPETVFGIHGNNIISKEIPLDKKLIEILGRI
jgi:ribosomal protein S18